MLAFLLSLFWIGLAVPPATPPDSLNEPYIIIEDIHIEGARKTQPRLILRELDFAQGDTLPGSQVKEILKRNRNKIFNTNLFVTVDLSLEPTSQGRIGLLIRVTERWYIFPMLIFELADRNFNEWWVDRNRDLRRTQYGVRVAHKNFRGRGEVLRATAQFGFTKRFDLAYNIRYLDRAQKSGLGFVVSYSDNRSVAYGTEYNKLVYFDDDSRVRDRFYAGVAYSHRPRFYGTHRVEARFHYNKIADTIARLNPEYFLDGKTTQRYAALSYQFTWDRRDIAAYPLKGHLFSAEVAQAGFTRREDFHQTAVGATYSIYQPLGKKFYWSMGFRGRLSTPGRQPYPNYRALGYGFDYVRGYEYNVIDGQHFALGKLGLKRELFSFEYTFRNLFGLEQFQTVPIAMYLTSYADAGYVHSPFAGSETNLLNNTLLYGGGLGIDIVTFYNVVFRINYSVNRHGDKGFFLHFVRDI
jgi:outer membrane protein assembly factor BamA